MAAVDDAVMCNIDNATNVCGRGPGARPRGEVATSSAVSCSAFEEEVQVGGRRPCDLEEDNVRSHCARNAGLFGRRCVRLGGKLGQRQQRIGIQKFGQALQLHDRKKAQFEKPTGSSIQEQGLHVEGGIQKTGRKSSFGSLGI